MDIKQPENIKQDLAQSFALSTGRSMFLTGKAGTGKTTLLKQILEATDKNYVVAAPTGVAAINCGGVTLHSLFSFPLQAFIPENNYNVPSIDRQLFCSYQGLAKHQKFNRAKLDLFLELELLVIDEISMVRADLFDAIDHTLRRVRKSNQPFGGVQLLLIGDLFQLAPVVRQDIEATLSHYYQGFYFFNALVWPKLHAVNIELEKVYRQEDQSFVDILNRVRDGQVSQEDLSLLNSRVEKNLNFNDRITLTTHNRQAEKINIDQLVSLKGSMHNLNAKVSGKFPDSSFPTPELIQLKIGAQVMFVRNHQEGLYYNGKIAEVVDFRESEIVVKSLDDQKKIIVAPVEWKNTKYNLDPVTDKIVKNDVGSFEQYPLKLAWAITVHKSQGLTFDEVNLDLKNTFASGQLYVALSRCRTLEGIAMVSEISAKNVITDSKVKGFASIIRQPVDLNSILEEAKAEYDNHCLIRSFDFNRFKIHFESWEDLIKEKDIPGKGNCLKLFSELYDALIQVEHISANYKSKLNGYFQNEKIDEAFIINRSSKAVDYFTEQIYKELLQPLRKHQAEYSVKKNSAAYTRHLDSIALVLENKIKKLYNLQFRNQAVYPSEPKITFTSKPITKAKQVGATYDITLAMHKEGKSINLIAKERGLSVSTIESHLAKLIQQQKVSIYDIMKPDKVEKALAVAQSYPDISLTELIKKIPFKISFGQLRCVTGYRDLLNKE